MFVAFLLLTVTPSFKNHVLLSLPLWAKDQIFFFYWSIIVFQCCVSSYCTTAICIRTSAPSWTSLPPSSSFPSESSRSTKLTCLYYMADFHLLSISHIVVVVQLLSRAWLLVTPWTLLSSTVSGSLLKFMSIESVMLVYVIATLPIALAFKGHPNLFPVEFSSLSSDQCVFPKNLPHWWPFPQACHLPSLLQRVFLTQGSNPGLLNCRSFTIWAIRWK